MSTTNPIPDPTFDVAGYAERMTALRTADGLSRRSVAALAGRSERVIQAEEGGWRAHSTVDVGLRVALATGADIRLLLDGPTDEFAASLSRRRPPPADWSVLADRVIGLIGPRLSAMLSQSGWAKADADRMIGQSSESRLTARWIAGHPNYWPDFGRLDVLCRRAGRTTVGALMSSLIDDARNLHASESPHVAGPSASA